jgi:hypothetical protein
MLVYSPTFYNFLFLMTSSIALNISSVFLSGSPFICPMASQVLSAEERASRSSFGILRFGPDCIICERPSRINLRSVLGHNSDIKGLRSLVSQFNFVFIILLFGYSPSICCLKLQFDARSLMTRASNLLQLLLELLLEPTYLHNN